MPPCCSAISSSPVYQRKATKQNLCIRSDETTNKRTFHFLSLSSWASFCMWNSREQKRLPDKTTTPRKFPFLVLQSGYMMRLCSPWRLAVPSTTVVSEYTTWHSAKYILFGRVCQNKLFLCFIPDLFVSQHPWEQTTKEALIRYSLYSWNESCN